MSISLQGDKNRIDKVLDAIRAGTKKSSTDNKISVTDDALVPSLKTFTVVQWTSTTRNITNPYDLVFQLRPADDEISKKEAGSGLEHDRGKHAQGRRPGQVHEAS